MALIQPHDINVWEASVEMSQSLYDAIGVSPSANQEEIEAACIRLGEELNPANNPGNLQAAIRFKEIEKAYEILGNSETRKRYDDEFRGGQEAGSSATAGSTETAKPNSKGLIWLAISIALGVAGWAVSEGYSYYNTQRLAKAEAKHREAVINYLLAYVKAGLKDPDSAKFQGVELFTDRAILKDGLIFAYRYKVCGALNAKNTYGAYVGSRHFMVGASVDVKSGDLKDADMNTIEDPNASEQVKKATANLRKVFCTSVDTSEDSVQKK